MHFPFEDAIFKVYYTSFTKLYIPALTSLSTGFAESSSSHGTMELKLLLYGSFWKLSSAVHVSPAKLHKQSKCLYVLTHFLDVSFDYTIISICTFSRRDKSRRITSTGL